MTSASRIEEGLRSRSWLPGSVTPDYDGHCISGVPGAILRLFGGEGLRALPFAVGVAERPPRRVVLLVLDALGWDLFRTAATELPALQRLAQRGQTTVLTSVFPSTTNVALTSLYTGLTPREHGLVGHTLFLRELGLGVDLLRFTLGGDLGRELLEARGFQSRSFAGVTTLFERLATLGVRGAALTRHTIQGSALAQIHHAGAEVVPFVSSSDLAVRVRQMLEDRDGARFLFAYWDLIDVLSHLHGPNSREVMAEIAAITFSLERELLEALSPAARSETLLLLVADHGQLPVPRDNAMTIADHPRLSEQLMLPPTGGPRYAYLHPLPGREAAAREYLETLPDRFLVLDSAEAMARGLWGTGEQHPEALHRTGPLLALLQGPHRLYRDGAPSRVLTMQGVHGGLAPEEMLVPFVALPLEAW